MFPNWTKTVLAIVVAGSMLTACEGRGTKETGGALVGAGLGALAGSQIGSGKGKLAAVGLGALLGAYAGSEVGKSLDKADQAYARQTAQNALESSPSGTRSAWSNPDSGHSGSITPTHTYQRSDGTYCREFRQTVTIEGKSEQAYGTACRQPDGSWKIVGAQ